VRHVIQTGKLFRSISDALGKKYINYTQILCYNHPHREDHLSLMKGQKDDPYVAVPRLADALAADLAVCLGQAASKDTPQSG
jgi:hypothetical protein